MFDLSNELDLIARGAVLTTAALIWVVVLVRIIGLRSFSKMTAFDFVATIATGSLLATAASASRWSDFFQVIIAIAALMAIQASLSAIRKASATARHLLGNTPILLMRDGKFIDEAMCTSRVAREDVLAKIRGANVCDISTVRAVVLENTGDMSVLSGAKLDQELLQGVRGTDADPH